MPLGKMQKALDLPRPFGLFISANVALGLLSVISYLFLKLVVHRHAGWYSPSFLPLQSPSPFGDFVCFYDRFRQFHSTSFFSSSHELVGYDPPFEYPAPAALLYRGFYAIPHPLRAYLAFLILTVGGLFLQLGKAMVRRGVRPAVVWSFLIAAWAFSYPFWFEFGTANLEYCIFLLMGGGVLAFLARRPNLAAVLWGTATAMKIFPFVFVALLLARKQYRQILLAAVVAVALNLVSLWAVCPSIAFAAKGIRAGLAVNRHDYMLPILRTAFDHSIWGFFKRIAYERGHITMPPRGLSAYLAVAAVVGLFLYFGRIRRLPILNQIVCLYVVAVLFPPTSHDYTLIHLYVPWALLILYTLDVVRRTQRMPQVTSAFCALAVICSAENFCAHNQMSFSAQVKCLALIALLIIALTKPWSWDPDQAASAAA